MLPSHSVKELAHSGRSVLVRNSDDPSGIVQHSGSFLRYRPQLYMPDTPTVRIPNRTRDEAVPLGRYCSLTLADSNAEGAPPEVHIAIKWAAINVWFAAAFRSKGSCKAPDGLPLMVGYPQI